MKVIADKRNCGKTRVLLNAAVLDDCYLVVSSQERARKLMTTCLLENIKCPKMLTYDELINKEYYGKGIKRVMIDDVDLLLHKLCLNLVIEAVSITI